MSGGRMPLSCLECKQRKLRCDRVSPSCGRCSRMGQECVFPHSRKPQTGRPKKIRELESKLREVEDQLAVLRPNRQPQASGSSGTPRSPSADVEPVDSGPDEAGSVPYQHALPRQPVVVGGQAIGTPPNSVETLESSTSGISQGLSLDLANAYFDHIAHCAPIIHRERFMASLSLPLHFQPPLCLQCIIMAFGAMFVPKGRTLAAPLYQRARNYAIADEARGKNQDVVSIAHVQCWILIANYEAQQTLFSQASASLCQAIGTAQRLKIHQLDKGSNGSIQESKGDWIELEEQRRTWWTLFAYDRLTSATTGLSVNIYEGEISTMLPVTDAEFVEGRGDHKWTLQALLGQHQPGQSVMAIRVITAYLCQQTLDLTSRICPGDCSKADQNNFWDRQRELDNSLALLLMHLPEDMRLPQNNRDLTALTINIEIHTSIIGLHRGTLWKLRCCSEEAVAEGNVREQQVRHSQERLLHAAEEMAHILRMAGDRSIVFKNPVLNFSAYLACLVFIEDYLETQRERSRSTAQFLLAILVTLCEDNVVARSLTKQVARDMSFAGIDVPSDLTTQIDASELFVADVGIVAANIAFRLFHTDSSR